MEEAILIKANAYSSEIKYRLFRIDYKDNSIVVGTSLIDDSYYCKFKHSEIEKFMPLEKAIEYIYEEEI